MNGKWTRVMDTNSNIIKYSDLETKFNSVTHQKKRVFRKKRIPSLIIVHDDLIGACDILLPRSQPTLKSIVRNKASWFSNLIIQHVRTYGVVFVEQVAPLVLHVEQQGEHDHDVDERDEGHDNQAAVHLF